VGARREVAQMSGSKEDQAKRKAERVIHEAERVLQREQSAAEENRRHEAMLAKTNRLRELRLAREAAEAAAKAKPG
jgi:hypothetical protein